MSHLTCSITDCGEITMCRGLCNRHYKQARRRGELDVIARKPVARGASYSERLAHLGWEVVPSGCWEFRGTVRKDGYGLLACGGGKSMLAHRMSYIVHKAPIPEGMVVRHTCDHPPCINPSHLVLGMQFDNVRDSIVRDRKARGENLSTHKLTDADCDEIRRLYADGMKMVDLHARFPQVARGQVYRVAVGTRRALPTNRGLAA